MLSSSGAGCSEASASVLDGMVAGVVGPALGRGGSAAIVVNLVASSFVTPTGKLDNDGSVLSVTVVATMNSSACVSPYETSTPHPVI